MNPKVDFYFHKSTQWQKELAQLRRFVLDCGLQEELKWGVPGYAFQQSNVALLHEFKSYCAILFVKGTLLSDAAGILIQQIEHTQAVRQLRFASLPEVGEREAVLKAYIYEAIKVEKLGLKVDFKKTRSLRCPL